MDLVFYDNYMQKTEVKNVIVKAQETTVVPMEQLKNVGPVSMVLLNDGDHAYTKYRLDSNTMARIMDVPITQIEDNLLRAQVWHHITMSMLDRQVSSVKLFDYLSENLPYETTE